METITIYVAGRARGNPGPAGVGVYIVDTVGEMLQEVAQAIGNATDDFATYHGVLMALQTLEVNFGAETKALQFEMHLDNELVKKQLNNEQQINDPSLVPFFIEIHNLRISTFPHLTLTQVSSEQNKEAERLTNEALDRN